MTKNCIMTALACLGLLFSSCGYTELPLAGGSSDTEISARVEGCAIDLEGKPASGVLARMRTSEFLPEDPNHISRNSYTDSNGIFIFDSVRRGSYSIELSGPDSIGSLMNCKVTSNDDQIVLDTHTLKPNAAISGHAILGSSRSSPSLQIYGLERSIKPDSTGFFIISVPEGRHCLRISGPEEYDEMEVSFEAFSSQYKYIGWFWLNPKLQSPCGDYACDSLTVRSILDSLGRPDIPVDSISVMRNGRIVELRLRGLGKKAASQSIGRLNFLEVLDLGQDSIDTPLYFLNQLWMLQVLSLDGNLIRYIPDNIGYLTFLRHLDLSGNELSFLPVSITNLKPFQLLNLSGNRLCTLPEYQKSWISLYDPDWALNQKCPVDSAQ